MRKIDDITDDRIAKEVFVKNVPGKQPRGRASRRWTNDQKMNL